MECWRGSTDGVTQIFGDPEHPANRGALCSKGSALGDTVGLQGRLLRPQMHGVDVEWDIALDAVAHGFRGFIERHGPDAVAFYVSGQLLTEDYYVANKLMKGFIGSANIDTNSRLCMASAVAAHKRAFGEDLVPTTYEDLDAADLIVLVGSNLAWCHPVLYQRILKAKELRPSLRIVVIDPRRTQTCDRADLHLPLRAGTDVTLFNGLLSWLAQHQMVDQAFIDAHTRGAARALLVADNTAGDAGAVARICGLDAQSLLDFYAWFGSTERVITLFSQGVNQSSSGTDKANSIINAHLLDGSNRPAGRRAVFHHRSTERDGWPRGGRARQHAGRPHGAGRREPSRASCRTSGGHRELRSVPVSRRSTYSRPCTAAKSKRYGSWAPILWSACRMPIAHVKHCGAASSSWCPTV